MTVVIVAIRYCGRATKSNLRTSTRTPSLRKLCRASQFESLKVFAPVHNNLLALRRSSADTQLCAGRRVKGVHINRIARHNCDYRDSCLIAVPGVSPGEGAR